MRFILTPFIILSVCFPVPCHAAEEVYTAIVTGMSYETRYADAQALPKIPAAYIGTAVVFPINNSWVWQLEPAVIIPVTAFRPDARLTAGISHQSDAHPIGLTVAAYYRFTPQYADEHANSSIALAIMPSARLTHAVSIALDLGAGINSDNALFVSVIPKLSYAPNR